MTREISGATRFANPLLKLKVTMIIVVMMAKIITGMEWV